MKLMVTGGNGFLGSHIAKELLKLGHNVLSFSRKFSLELEKCGVEVLTGDIADEMTFVPSTEGCDAIFHVAAKPGVWGPYEEYYRTNFIGTKNVITACRKNGIKKLIYTSSPSVIFDDGNQEGIDESTSYPEKYLAHYPKTKAMAEKLVLDSNSDKLATVSLRPHIIWGPGDNHLIPRLIDRAKSGKLRLVGNGKNLIDSVYIDNAVSAHILAYERLSPGSPISGRVYFISNGEPIPISQLMNRILDAAALPPVTKKIPANMAFMAGAFMELIYWLLHKKEEPLMTRFLAKELSGSHWYNIDAARKDLGYIPSVSIEDGIKKLRECLNSKD